MKYYFQKSTVFDCSVEKLFMYHKAEGALSRLTPPWETAVPAKVEGEPLQKGTRVYLKVKAGGMPLDWVAEHVEYEENIFFKDVQLKGPFKTWEHSHYFEKTENGTKLTDVVEFELPFGVFGRFGKKFVFAKLDKMFERRHLVTALDIKNIREKGGENEISVTGTGGLIGRQLLPYLSVLGHVVHKLKRHSGGYHIWDYQSCRLENWAEDTDTVVHLAGEPIGDNRWTSKRKKLIYESRVEGTKFLVDKILSMEKKPKTFICASAIGYYGNRGDELVNEASSGGSDYISEVCEAWENEALRLKEAGIRVVLLRVGVALCRKGGAFYKFMLPFQFGLGGWMGSGKHWFGWVSVEDVIRSIDFIIKNEKIEGAVNLVSPNPATHKDFAKRLGAHMHRPVFISIPAFSIKAVFGQMGEELLLSSTKAYPKKLIDNGFEFLHPELEDSFKWLLG